ncbi:hypothetical protein [Pedobacter rhodius]|uniref:DUF3575 domain-containing protein n=1 Tax=Pedobacter rhodius TaxID=3004098 RepID=A0ABT4KV78_9SPHI|nr:hypothetical protein [Pedobacter sp. SJ11]MCZ4222734.1 hypothetical protein [Pedobacter sp. SJ11]
MKRYFLFAIFMVNFTTAFAQTDSLSKSIKAKSDAIGHGGNNEIRINLLYTVIGIPEVTYERLLEDNMGVGISVAVRLTDENVFGSRFNYIITPHYRLYFGSKKANGFFIEGNAGVVSYKESDYSSLAYTSYPPNFDYSVFDKNYTKLGLGVAGGAKFLTRNGFLGEAYLGLGRVFGSQSIDVYPRFGLSIGKRF